MTLCIRSGHQDDVVACVEILRLWVDEHARLPNLNDTAELVDFWRKYFFHELSWVAERDGRIVGFCVRGDDNISALHVAPDMRNQGIGKRLLDAAKDGRDWITVWAYAKNTRALKFYHREGLVEVSREIEEGTNLVDIEHVWKRAKKTP